MAEVDVVVVNYNAASFLDACLSSVEANVGSKVCASLDESSNLDANARCDLKVTARIASSFTSRIVVIDSASTDDSHAIAAKHAAKVPGVIVNSLTSRIVVIDNASTDDSHAIVTKHAATEWLSTGVNLGFGRAANRGVAATSAPYVLVLNPDTVLDTQAIAEMAAVLNNNPAVGVVAPQVVNVDGSRYPSARSFPNLIDAAGHAFVGLITANNRWSRRYLNPGRIDWVSGTAMLIRRTAFDAVGGFDEDYFMYVEDVDLCWRLRENNWSVAVAENSRVTHHIGGSSEQRPLRMILAHHRSLLRFEARTATGSRRLMFPFVALGLGVRTIAAIASRSIHRKAPASTHR